MAAELLSWSIEAGYIDAHGSPQAIDPAALQTLAGALDAGGMDKHRRRSVAVLRAGEAPAIRISDVAAPLRWRLFAKSDAIASGEAGEAGETTITLPSGLDIGSYRLAVDAAGGAQRDILILVAPDAAFQPPLFRDGGCAWLLMVQLYGVRSARNWGHGDFGDLSRLLEIAEKSGAAGIGLNPLHALTPGQASAYSPSSRIFLNSLYIDMEAIDEFPGTNACGLTEEVARLRTSDVVDYPAVHAAKRAALRATYEAFRTHATTERRRDFAAFCERVGDPLRRFAIFETLQEQFGFPWQNWPRQWHEVSFALDRYHEGLLGDVEFHAFIQWTADRQLRACARKAQRMALPVGLYLDVAVGVEGGGADAWAAPNMLCRKLFIGAPPDVYNPRGQNWQLASFHPQALIDSDLAMFRQMLRSVIQYAGAIRIDHALGLNRLYLIPEAASAACGGYVRFPFAAMLAALAQESAASRCLIIGEDLGTIPEGVCEALNRWGVWSYRVALFEREHDGAFRRPEHFPEKAIVTFNTHDLPTFAGWKASHDLKVKAALGLDPGESELQRHDALNAMRATLERHGLAPDLAFLDVLRYLARTRCQLLAVSIEDVLALADQPNVPGTTTEHPNWRRRLPLDIEEIARHETLDGVANVMAAEGRSCVKSSS